MDVDFDSRFGFHAGNETTIPLHEKARAICRQAALDLFDFVPEGRELALVVTHLEEAMFWANAGIARNLGQDI